MLLSTLILCSILLNSVNSEKDSPSVIIVGAGPSGIAAASKLFQNGFKNITIFEAENRIGGRVYTTLFQPSLSEEKIKTIKGLGYGNVAKVYLSFEEPWWINNDSTNGLMLLWKDEDIAQLENDHEKSWLLGLVGFWRVEHKSRLLCGWVAGKYSREMEKLSEQQVFNHSVEVLQRFFGKSYNITKPTGMIRSLWSSNKHFRGTYTFRSTKSDADNIWHATLAEPITKEKPECCLICWGGNKSASFRDSKWSHCYWMARG